MFAADDVQVIRRDEGQRLVLEGLSGEAGSEGIRCRQNKVALFTRVILRSVRHFQ